METEKEANEAVVSVSGPEINNVNSSLNMADASYPRSYTTNTSQENELLAIADNFHRQFSHLHPERKRLLLCPVNECGVKKFVSTTIRPAPTDHPELYSWQGCASFVSDFLTLEPLELPYDPPARLFSSTLVMQNQRATSFEYAVLLCGLLLGADYDAYCVSGYAHREMCLLDQRLQDCPLLGTQAEVASEHQSPQDKYTVRPPRQLKSHFEEQLQEKKKEQEAEAASLHEQEVEEPGEQRPFDPLWVHCWVLVLSGCRGVQENFFIDPLSGLSYSTDTASFLGIESLWNTFNCYVNKQDCGRGCGDVLYDLEDVNLWEPVIYGATSKKELMLEIEKDEQRLFSQYIEEDEDVQLAEYKEEEKEEEDEEEPQPFAMPTPWVTYINITNQDLETRFPRGQKVNRYRKAKLEQFVPYLRMDGLVSRLSLYKDRDCTEVAMVKEEYLHRSDHLEQREVNKVEDFTTDRFKRGRRFHLIFHRYRSMTVDSIHEMEFSDAARVDDLVWRVVTPGEMTETFHARPDFLYYRRSVFGRHVQFSQNKEADPKIHLVQVVERFHRDESKAANEDVAERVFMMSEGRIDVTFHLREHRIIALKMSFTTAAENTQQRRGEELTPAQMECLRTPTLREMTSLMADEDKVSVHIKESMKEVRDIVSCREKEETDIYLLFSPWTTVGAARARTQREEMESLAEEEHQWLLEKEKDILAPVLLRLSNPRTLSAKDAKHLRQDCLNEFRHRLAERQNIILQRFEKEKQELQMKQEWYQRNQLNMTEQEEEEYQRSCCEKTLTIHVIEKRLDMHKEEAPAKLLEFDHKLREDDRLVRLLLKCPH
uniref:dynein regulatory complex subunit 7-like isoform X2 n=1 Tax=Solea senegalensis TaxID=28829 RepID=UPI001CD8FBA1|nr:dynein regulatory complex subunit 7-like isoform X2 [Solea senegalensis]